MILFLKSLWFQLLWFLAVLGKGDFLIILLVLVACTYAFSWYKNEISIEFAAIIAGIGFVVDSVNIYFKVLSFDTYFVPLWLIGLWLIFAWYCWQIRALLIRLSLLSVIILGGAGGALSYLAGYKLNAVALPLSPVNSVIILLLEWILLSCSVRLLISKRWEQI